MAIYHIHPSRAAIASAWADFTPASSANDRQRVTASRTSPMIFRPFDAERLASREQAIMSSSVIPDVLPLTVIWCALVQAPSGL